MIKEQELNKGCGKLLKIGQGNLSHSKTRELGVVIKCGEKYNKDKFHKRKEYIGKIIYCSECIAQLKGFKEDKAEAIRKVDEIIDELETRNKGEK